jgi:hypothetical protein
MQGIGISRPGLSYHAVKRFREMVEAACTMISAHFGITKRAILPSVIKLSQNMRLKIVRLLEWTAQAFGWESDWQERLHHVKT